MITFDTYRKNFINEILLASSRTEVNSLIDKAFIDLENNKVNGFLIERFMEKTTSVLQTYLALNYSAQQWSNIHAAKMHLNNIKDTKHGILN